MESPFAPFSGGDLLPPATTSGGMANDSPPPCNRCGFGGCDIRVAGCGCLLHTVSTLCFPVLAYVGTGTNPTSSFFHHRRKPEAVPQVNPMLFLGDSIETTSNLPGYMLASMRQAYRMPSVREKHIIMCQFCDTSLAHDPFHSRLRTHRPSFH